MSSVPIRILAADDHTLLRSALCLLLSKEADLEIVGQAVDGPETVRLATELQPDIVLLDLEMPGSGPLVTIRSIKEAAPVARVIVLTMHDDDMVQTLLAEGAVGYLHKSATRELLLSAIHGAVAGGTTVFTPWNSGTPARRLPEPPETADPLTAREREVLECVAQAMTNRRIGRQLGITEGTVKRHLRNIFAKLGAATRLDAVNKALSAGVIEQP